MKKILISYIILILILIALFPTSFSKDRKEFEPPSFPKNEKIEEIPLRLKAKTFDPLKEKRIETLSILSGENYIVQLKGPVKREWKESLDKLVEIYDYIPEYAFLVRAKSENLEKIKKLPFVRWVGKYEAEYKIEPEILKEEIDYFSLIEKNKENRSFKILLFSPEDLEKVSEFISRLNGNVLKKEGTKIIASIENEKIKDIASLKEVKWIEFYREPVLLLDVSTSIIKAKEVWNLFNGSGIKVAVVDTGIDNGNLSSLHPDLRGRIINLTDYTETDESDGIAEDPLGHGTHVAGIIAGSGNASDGNYTGVAPSSFLVIQRVFNDLGFWEAPENLTILFNDSKNLGAQIVSNSWGLRWSWGEYTDFDKEADDVVKNYSLIVIFSAGNDGPYMESTLSPSNAKNVISVGASENNKTLNATYGGSYCDNPNEVASFSSRGPTNDKRVKPDLVAPGTAILSTKSSLASNSTFEPYGGVVEGNGGDYAYATGTSMAAPHVAGAATVILEYFNKTFSFFPSPALVKALLINGADDMGYGYISYEQGWGRLNIKNSIIENESRRIVFKEENNSISTGNYSAFKFFIQNNSMLKITLVWTDWPGNPVAEKMLVNDLDLSVLTPSGFTRKGNDFSFPYDDERDDRNNVENVFINISEIEEGNYTVVVYGYNIPMEPQKFALVLSGNLTEVEMLPNEDVFPPTIWNVTPGNNQTTIEEIEIRANVTDNVEVSKVWIEYSNDTINWNVSEMSFNGEIYNGSLNVTSEGTWIYRVLANDTSGKISSSKYYYLWTEEPRKIFVVRSVGTDSYYLNYMPWEKLNSNWFYYGLKPIEINYTFLNIPNITYENLTESKADVLLIACACDTEYEFTN
ncbi:MAG: S8 family serine peptidase, partial [Candidatus Anstonellales archaeon]